MAHPRPAERRVAALRGPRRWALVVAVAVAVGGLGRSQAAAGGARRLVVLLPNGPGSTEQAAPRLAALARRIETLCGWPAGAMAADYHPILADGLRALAERRTGFALLATGLYAEQARRLGATVIGRARPLDEPPGGARLHVVVREPRLGAIGDLRGRRLASNHLGARRYVERVVLGGALRLGAEVELVETSEPLRAVKQVLRGQADGALIDDAVRAHLGALEGGATLRTIFSSSPLAPMPLVALRGAAPRDVAALVRALPGICAGSDGHALCAELELRALEPSDDRAYRSLVQAVAP